MGWRPVVGAAVLALGMSLVTVVAPGAAQAAPGGTIVFIKGHNVWLVKPDGSGQYQVTRDGTASAPYRSPSMSDSGIIAAAKGAAGIHLMRQNGDPIRSLFPGTLPLSNGSNFSGPPAGTSISPDGSKVAYYYVQPGASPLRTATGVITASGAKVAMGNNYFRNPSWVTNSRLMTHGGYGSQMMLQDLGGSPVHWFDDSDVVDPMVISEDLDDGAVSRDGSRLAVRRGHGEDTTLFLVKVTGNVRTGAIGSIPTPTYGNACATNEDVNFASPSWGPDHRSMVVAETGGLVVITEGPTCTQNVIRSIAPGGSEPHWSPAALNPGKKAAGTKAKAKKLKAKKLKAKKRPRIKGKPRVGKKVKATKATWSAKPRKLKYRWFRNGKAIKGKKGAKRVYKVRRADRGKRLQVRIVAQRPGFTKAKVKSKPVRVRR